MWVVCMGAMVVKKQFRNHLHKNRVLFPKDGNSIVFNANKYGQCANY